VFFRPLCCRRGSEQQGDALVGIFQKWVTSYYCGVNQFTNDKLTYDTYSATNSESRFFELLFLLISFQLQVLEGPNSVHMIAHHVHVIIFSESETVR
jgi:hypothetical protein